MAIKQVATTLATTLAVCVVALFYFTSKNELISFIVAFSTSSLVVLASFKNYKNMVLKRLQTLEDSSEVEYQDAISKLEDPYNLYDEEEQDSSNPKDIDNQAQNNKRDKKEIAKDTLVTFAPIRILAYALFTMAFFLLLKSGYFDLKFYVATLIIPNIISAIFLVFFIKK